MSTRLQQAFAEAAKLPEEQQEAFAQFLLEELRDEQAWQAKFASTGDKLALLAAEARAEYATGKTKPLTDLLK